MTEHREEGPIDRIKDALDVGDEPRTADSDDDLAADRPSGWAGVTDALDDTANRPAGPDYGADEGVGGRTGADLDDPEAMSDRPREDHL